MNAWALLMVLMMLDLELGGGLAWELEHESDDGLA